VTRSLNRWKSIEKEILVMNDQRKRKEGTDLMMDSVIKLAERRENFVYKMDNK
jgi:hypothetical protein